MEDFIKAQANSITNAPSELINGNIMESPEMTSDASSLSSRRPQGTGRCVPRSPLGVAKDPSQRSGGSGRFPPYPGVCLAQ
jgi:hypothetical protein